MLELLKVIFKDEKRTVGHSIPLRAYLIDGDCNVGDIVLVNTELGNDAKLIRVVTEVLPTDGFTMAYLVTLDTMKDVVLMDTLEIGSTFVDRTSNWKGEIEYVDGNKVLNVYGGIFKKDLKATHIISEDKPNVYIVDELNRDGYANLMFDLDGTSTHVSELADRSVDIEMLERMRMNSYVQDKLPPKLTTEALIARAEIFKTNCGFRNMKTTTYEESLVHVLVPELLVRLKELNDRVRELEGSSGNVSGGSETV